MNIPVRQYWHLLRAYLAPHRAAVALLALALAGSIALQLAGPQVVRYFIDTVREGGASATLTTAAILFVGAALAQQGLAVLATYIGQDVGWAATNALREDLAAHCLGLDLSFHKARTPGEMIERIDGDAGVLSNFFSSFAVQVLGNAALLLGVLVLLALTDWRIGLAMAGFAAVALAVLVRIRELAAPHWVEVREESARLYGFLGESLAATEDARSSGAVPYVLRRFVERLRGLYPVQRRGMLAGAAMWTTTIFIFALGDAMAFVLAGLLYRAGEVSLGTAYIVFFYTALLARPIEQIRSQLQDLQKADAAISRVRELLATRSRLEDGPGVPLPAGPLSVQFERVTFAYEDEGTAGTAVLREVSFALEPGRVLGLLGRTGSGKTTVARLLFRLYDPQGGEVRLGGVPLPLAHLRELRARVGMVTQEVQLFHASVRDNLTFFDPEVPDARLWAALDELGLSEWAHGLPEGLGTALEPGSLSAGEAQLLAFARLLLADPGLVILDEASSRLDPATEAKLERAVARLLAGRTGIVIAHRLSTVARVDDLLILERGEVLEHGPRHALAADRHSRFSELLRVGLEEVLA